MLRLSLLFLLFATILQAQDAKTYAIMIETKIDDTGFAPQVVISWQNDTLAARYVISKRKYETGEFEKIAEISGGANIFSDLDVDYGQITEYEVEKVFSYDNQLLSTFAYKAIAWDADLVEKETKSILILVDYIIYDRIKVKLDEYISVINREGWNAIVKQVPRVETFNPKAVLSNRELILAVNKSEKNLKSVLILGRVAVPYSGNIAPDGHGDDNSFPHKGAYPTDAFYADFDKDDWTDTSASNIKSAMPRQHNVVNDGKWDQSFIPNKVELSIGRVDLYDLDFFEETEVELLNRYLDKNIAYRTGKLKADNRAIIYDGFDYRQSGYAADGWNNLTALYGRDNVIEKRVKEELPINSYEMVYANAEGAFENIYDAIYIEDIAKTGYKAIHSMLFGSYNVDWDSPNNLLRGVIASQPMGLTAVWGTRPFWTYFKLGLGETFGQALVSTQNNRFEYSYPSTIYNGGVHIALMGDPTLKLINDAPIMSAGFSTENGIPNTISLRLKKDSEIYGYQVLLLDKYSYYQVYETVWFDQPRKSEFSVSFNGKDIDPKYFTKGAIIRPIISVENLSGRFMYLGNGINIE